MYEIFDLTSQRITKVVPRGEALIWAIISDYDGSCLVFKRGGCPIPLCYGGF